jgi:hypothetical protein
MSSMRPDPRPGRRQTRPGRSVSSSGDEIVRAGGEPTAPLARRLRRDYAFVSQKILPISSI